MKIEKPQNIVYLVGCGLGDVELLTIKAYNTIQKVDVVLYDYLISQEILDIIPKYTKKVFVGKKKGHHSLAQDEINKIILKYAKEGKSVARLKSGDPFVFGRGSEELYEMTKFGIKTEVIPGISSSIAGSSQAMIPITARGYSSGFSVVTAHLKNDKLNLDWIDLLNKKNHSVVVLMGLTKTKEIQQKALGIGIDKNKDCAIVSNASRENQKVVLCKLDELYEKSKGIESPAILIFGDVVKYKKDIELLSFAQT